MVTTTAVAAPLSTLVPRKQTLLSSSGGRLAASSRPANFSTGNDSPVRLAWMRNRSLQASSRTSAGIMSPAASSTTSPGTRWPIGSFARLAVTEDGRLDADHRLQLGGRRIGPRLLHEAQDHSQGHHEEHDDGRTIIVAAIQTRLHGGKGGEHEQQDHERIDQGLAQQLQVRMALLAGHDVGTVFVEAPAGLGLGQSLAGGLQLDQHRFGVVTGRFQ